MKAKVPIKNLESVNTFHDETALSHDGMDYVFLWTLAADKKGFQIVVQKTSHCDRWGPLAGYLSEVITIRLHLEVKWWLAHFRGPKALQEGLYQNEDSIMCINSTDRDLMM